MDACLTWKIWQDIFADYSIRTERMYVTYTTNNLCSPYKYICQTLRPNRMEYTEKNQIIIHFIE